MQRLVTGIDEQGRSCVVSRDVPEPVDGGPGVSVIETLLDTAEPIPPPRPTAHSDFHDLEVGPGLVRYLFLDWEAGGTFPMHHTDTIDIDTILGGSMELTLGDGVHVLNPGDSVVINGVDHAWCAGPEGCQMSLVLLGTPAP